MKASITLKEMGGYPAIEFVRSADGRLYIVSERCPPIKLPLREAQKLADWMNLQFPTDEPERPA